MPTNSRCAVLSFIFAILLTGPLAAAEVKVDAELGGSVLPTTNPGKVYLRLSLKTLASSKREHRTPINAAIVIDRSGSMQGDRIVAAKEGARVAIERLSSDDTISIVAFNHNVDVLSPAAPLRSAQDELKRAIDRLSGGRDHRALRRRQRGRPAGRGVPVRQEGQPRRVAVGRTRQCWAIVTVRLGRARPQARLTRHLGFNHRARPRLQRRPDAAPCCGERRQSRVRRAPQRFEGDLRPRIR